MTTTTDRDWDRINAGYRAVDAARDIIGHLLGDLDEDPDAPARLRTAVAELLADDEEAQR